jgi:hypothetical protein
MFLISTNAWIEIYVGHAQYQIEEKMDSKKRQTNRNKINSRIHLKDYHRVV